MIFILCDLPRCATAGHVNIAIDDFAHRCENIALDDFAQQTNTHPALSQETKGWHGEAIGTVRTLHEDCGRLEAICASPLMFRCGGPS